MNTLYICTYTKNSKKTAMAVKVPTWKSMYKKTEDQMLNFPRKNFHSGSVYSNYTVKKYQARLFFMDTFTNYKEGLKIILAGKHL